MKINLRTAVSRLFPKHSFEMIYIEAIANALDAKATTITIDINYKEGKFNHFRIIDNGIGIDESRYQRFSNLMDVQDASHKGQGRLVYLHYFNDIQFKSIYKENGNVFERNFAFNYDFDDSLCKIVSTSDKYTKTEISFSGFLKDRIRNKDNLNPAKIKEIILSEFLPAFYKMKEDAQDLNIEIKSNIDNLSSSDIISTNDIPDFSCLRIENDELKNIGFKLLNKINGDLFREPLSLYYHVKNTSKESSIVTSFAIDNRAIKVPIINKENYIDGFDAIFFMHSKCFDGQVDPTRQELTIDKKDF